MRPQEIFTCNDLFLESRIRIEFQPLLPRDFFDRLIRRLLSDVDFPSPIRNVSSRESALMQPLLDARAGGRTVNDREGNSILLRQPDDFFPGSAPRECGVDNRAFARANLLFRLP